MTPTCTIIHTVEGTPVNGCCQCLCPWSELQSPPTSLGDSPRPAGRSGPASYQIIAFDLGPRACEILCEPLRVKSLFPPVLWNS